MIIEVRDAVHPAQRTFRTSHEEKIGLVILDLLQNATWARLAREMVTAPSLGGARVVRRIKREGGALEVREVRCSREVFEEVEAWIEKLREAGWRSWPVAQGQQEEEKEFERWLEDKAREEEKWLEDKAREEEKEFERWLEHKTREEEEFN